MLSNSLFLSDVQSSTLPTWHVCSALARQEGSAIEVALPRWSCRKGILQRGGAALRSVAGALYAGGSIDIHTMHMTTNYT